MTLQLTRQARLALKPPIEPPSQTKRPAKEATAKITANANHSKAGNPTDFCHGTSYVPPSSRKSKTKSEFQLPS